MKINLGVIASILGTEGHRIRDKRMGRTDEKQHFINSRDVQSTDLISNILTSGRISQLLPGIKCVIGKWGIKNGSNEGKIYAFGLHFSTF